MSTQPKIALVHDDFVQAGGAESLFATIAFLYPNVPIYTSIVDWSKLPSAISQDRIKTSFIQKFFIFKKEYKLLLPLYPFAFESFNFDDFDVVISSTTRFAKAILTKPKTIHICYINSSPRFLWKKKVRQEYLPKPAALLLAPYFSWLRRWDKVAASRVDHYIANSLHVARQVKKIYGRDAQVVYPFVDLDFFKPAKVHNWQLKSQNYYLTVSRLVKWKKVDIAIKACCDLGKNLIIVGVGPDRARLKQLTVNSSQFTDSSIEFLGRVTKDKLRELYQNAQALIVTQEEDFGLAAVEAQACGIPVLAYKRGGLVEVVNEQETGLFFSSQTDKSLEDAIVASTHVKWSLPACRKNALRFSKANFTKRLKQAIFQYASKSP